MCPHSLRINSSPYPSPLYSESIANTQPEIHGRFSRPVIKVGPVTIESPTRKQVAVKNIIYVHGNIEFIVLPADISVEAEIVGNGMPD